MSVQHWLTLTATGIAMPRAMARFIASVTVWASVTLPGSMRADPLMFVSEYATGNVRAYDSVTGHAVTLPSAYTPVGGAGHGADGMATDAQGRLYVNRDGGDIYRSSLDGRGFAVFTTVGGAPTLLDLTRNDTHLFAASFGSPVIYRVSLTDGTIDPVAPHPDLLTSDGVRIGPDGRLYAVDSSDGEIYALELSTNVWSPFLGAPPTVGMASQLEFSGDYVYVSRTIGGQGRIYRYALDSPGDYAGGLDEASETLVGSMGSTTATGIRLGPDGRLYANAFDRGEVWRSNADGTAMEASAWITGLNEPGSIFFASGPELPMSGVVAWHQAMNTGRSQHGSFPE